MSEVRSEEGSATAGRKLAISSFWQERITTMDVWQAPHTAYGYTVWGRGQRSRAGIMCVVTHFVDR